MKKLFLLATVACLALSSCDDVPAPYEIFDINNVGTGGGGLTGSLPYTNANLKDWSANNIKGAAWDLGNTYAKITGYAGGSTQETEAWLVSPAISLEGVTAAHISFDHVIRYVAANAPLSNHTMWITDGYSGDVAAATWAQLDYKPVESATRDWTFYAADEINIPADFVGKKVYVAFKFICGAESSTTWEINNLKIAEGEANIGGDTPPIPVEYEHISIADFIAKADANTTYEITGVASKLNATYASLDLTEDDATVYVYKMIDATGVNVDFAGLNIAEGDTVTVTGKYYKYEDKNGNVKHELNPGTYVRHKKANGGQVTPPTPVTGDNLLANGDFETWADNLPTNWKTASSAGNATLSKSEDAHGGSFSVKVGGTESTNKRLAYKEITLTAGKYVFSFYAKGTLDAKTQTKGGYVPVTNGTVGSYTYASAYTDLNNKDWTQVSYEFTLTEQTTLALVVMNVKTSSYATAQDILVDDAVLTSSDGGQIVDGGEVTPPTPSGDAEAITVAEFLQKADANTTYRLTGVVKNIKSTVYGNFDLEDATGSVYVYGLLDLAGASKNFESLGIKEGDTVTLEGKYSTYKDAPQIVNAQYVSHVSGGEVTPPTPGEVKAISVAEFLQKADANTTYRLTGEVKNIKSTVYGNFDLVDATGSIYIYGLLDLAGAAKNFESLGIKEGDTVTLEGKYTTYKESPQIANAQYVSHVAGAGSGDPTPEPDPTPDPTPAGDGMSLSAITSAISDFPSNAYGSQAAADESTWASWTYDGVTYKGARICSATAIANTIQVQGNASDASKQGFIFNATAFASDIKSVTVVLKVKDGSSAYDPSYSLYAGTSVHPVSDAVTAATADPAYTVAEGIRTYTQVFDLSAKNCKYFTIMNDKTGALYIDKVIVTLK